MHASWWPVGLQMQVTLPCWQRCTQVDACWDPGISLSACASRVLLPCWHMLKWLKGDTIGDVTDL